jgi:hypothetical protein
MKSAICVRRYEISRSIFARVQGNVLAEPIRRTRFPSRTARADHRTVLAFGESQVPADHRRGSLRETSNPNATAQDRRI